MSSATPTTPQPPRWVAVTNVRLGDHIAHPRTDATEVIAIEQLPQQTIITVLYEGEKCRYVYQNEDEVKLTQRASATQLELSKDAFEASRQTILEYRRQQATNTSDGGMAEPAPGCDRALQAELDHSCDLETSRIRALSQRYDVPIAVVTKMIRAKLTTALTHAALSLKLSSDTGSAQTLAVQRGLLDYVTQVDHPTVVATLPGPQAHPVVGMSLCEQETTEDYYMLLAALVKQVATTHGVPQHQVMMGVADLLDLS